MRHKQFNFKRKAYLHGYEPCLIAELEQEREWMPIPTCEMPIIAIIGAVASGIAGAGMIGTAVLGSTMLGTIIGGAMIVGSALTVVGTISGNKKLTKIGGALSLVGGVSAGIAGLTGNITNSAGQAMGMGDVFNNGMGKISDAWGKLSGTTGGLDTVSNTANAGSESLVQSVQVGDVGGVEGLNSQGYVAPEMGAAGSSGTAGNATDFSLTGSGNATDYSLAGGNKTALGFNPDTALGTVPSNPLGSSVTQAGDKGGLLSGMFGKDSGTVVGHMLSGAADGAGKYMSAKEEAAALEKIRQGDISMASNGPLLIDPNSPNRAEWEGYAKQHGTSVVGLDVNMTNWKMPMAGQNPNLPAHLKPGANPVTAPVVRAPQAPTVGLLKA